MAKKRKKLSVAQLHWGFPPIIGGVETHLTILLPTLAKKGHRVNLLTASFEGQKARDTYKGVGIHREPIMDLNWLSQRGLDGIADEVQSVLSKFIDETSPDCVHVHNMHYFSKPHARAIEELCTRKGIPLVLTAHNVWDDNLFLDLTKNIKWTHIIAVSHFIKREIMGTGYPHGNITVIHHGIDEKIYTPKVDPRLACKKYPMLRGKKVVFHPARMGLAKGCDVSIKALRLVKATFPDVVLILAGTRHIIDWTQSQPQDIAYMVNLIEFLDLKDNVLVDVFPLEDMPWLYAASDVCVYPSTVSEPFGLTMLEALASGKPMIVTQAGGMPEIIKDGINGFIIPVKDYGSLSARIVELLASDELREQMGQTGRQMVEQLYTKAIVTEQTLQIYEKFC